MNVNASKAFALVCGVAVLIVGTTPLLISRPANATPAFATQTGKACSQCHESPTGGGALTPYGKAFKANGNK
jgi:hypothetical protein